ASVARLIAPIRTALGDTTPESTQLTKAETYTASSLEAAHAYALGQQNLGNKQQDAIRYYEEAIRLDPNLGRAYAGLGAAYNSLKDLPQAKAYYEKALALEARMSEREKLRTFGVYYTGVANNFEKGEQTLKQLTLLFPADAAAYTNLSTAYKRLGR